MSILAPRGLGHESPLTSKWLRTAVKDVAAATIVDLKAWKKSQS
jgi:hypothetical protein